MNWLPAAFAGFAWPWALLALPLPWLAWRLLPPRRPSGAALRMPHAARLAEASAKPGRGRQALRSWALAFAALAWVLLCLAAARPQQLGEPQQPPRIGRELMLAVDLSGSMGDEDMLLGGRPVDRLTAAKAVLADFLDRREGDLVGLLVFGRRAYVLAPPTHDLDTVRQQLIDSTVGLAGRETAIGDAIGLAVKRLRDRDAADDEASEREAGERVLVLLTDGVNTAGLLEPLKAAELARAYGVRVHTVAFGGAGGELSMFGYRLPMPGGGDEIDEATLQAVAETTGGRMFRARDAQELAGIYAEIDRLEPVERPGPAARPRIEIYPWPLGLALVCALLAMLGRHGRWRSSASRAPAVNPGAGS
ncbi:VWA domain-containing protein [Luteimonas sp. MJ293]|uniref:vWA domain-containing protein n=1 Tax=Luteimonas sp. MJ146 TaxID=3129240 RepID=UPI0031B9F67A